MIVKINITEREAILKGKNSGNYFLDVDVETLTQEQRVCLSNNFEPHKSGCLLDGAGNITVDSINKRIEVEKKQENARQARVVEDLQKNLQGMTSGKCFFPSYHDLNFITNQEHAQFIEQYRALLTEYNSDTLPKLIADDKAKKLESEKQEKERKDSQTKQREAIVQKKKDSILKALSKHATKPEFNRWTSGYMLEGEAIKIISAGCFSSVLLGDFAEIDCTAGAMVESVDNKQWANVAKILDTLPEGATWSIHRAESMDGCDTGDVGINLQATVEGLLVSVFILI